MALARVVVRNLHFFIVPPQCAVLDMRITVNGQCRETVEETTVAELLNDLSLTGKPVAVEVNLELVPRHATPSTV